MRYKTFTIAGGNTTLFVWDCPLWKRQAAIAEYLGIVEQIGFVTSSGRVPKLTMMGNELCINATLALASMLQEKGTLRTSGYDKPVRYVNSLNQTQIQLSLSYNLTDNRIILPGIGFVFSENALRNPVLLRQLANKYRLPAFGAIGWKNGQIQPVIFVKETDSVINETACGSGSIAASIMFGVSKVRQPSLEYIYVRQENDTFTVKARVARIKI